MTELRNDIFKDLSEPRKHTISQWVHEAFEAIKTQFPSKDAFIEYLNSFENSDDVELFIKICNFYLVAKKYVQAPFVKLIMIISMIEKLILRERGVRYTSFQDWILSQNEKIENLLSKYNQLDMKTFKKIIESLKKDYYSTFGSRRNFSKFFEKYITDRDKVKLVKSFGLNITPVVIEYSMYLSDKENMDSIKSISELRLLHENIEIYDKAFMPLCYDWKYCFVLKSEECVSDAYCKFLEDKQYQKEIFGKIINFIYKMRSDFVHNAKIPAIGDKGDVIILDVFDKRPILVEFTAEELQEIFERALKNFFDSLQRC